MVLRAHAPGQTPRVDLAPGTMLLSILIAGSGSFIAAGQSRLSVVGSRISTMPVVGGAWQVSGCGVGLVWSSARPMVNGELVFTSTHSTNAAKLSLGPSAGILDLDRGKRHKASSPGSVLGMLDVKCRLCGLPADGHPAPGRESELQGSPWMKNKREQKREKTLQKKNHCLVRSSVTSGCGE